MINFQNFKEKKRCLEFLETLNKDAQLECFDKIPISEKTLVYYCKILKI